METSEQAKGKFKFCIKNMEILLKLYQDFFTKIDFITTEEASEKLNVSHNEIKKMIKKNRIIFFNAHLFNFIPVFQFDNNKINPLFLKLLDLVKDDLLVINSLLKDYNFYQKNELGSESKTSLNGIEYIKRFGEDGVKHVAECIHNSIFHNGYTNTLIN